MTNISEALVATAVGLLVAIPAVAAFNWFQRIVRATLANTDALSHVLLAHLKATGDGGRRRRGRDRDGGRARRAPEQGSGAQPRRTRRQTDGWRRTRRRDEAITGINVTPLVDIVLVLLIIFMVTAKLIVSKSVPLDLPKAASGSDIQTVFSIVLAADGTTQIDSKTVAERRRDPRAGEGRAREEPRAPRDHQSRHRRPHGRVIHVLDLLKQAQVAKIAFGVSPVAPGGPGRRGPCPRAGALRSRQAPCSRQYPSDEQHTERTGSGRSAALSPKRGPAADPLAGVLSLGPRIPVAVMVGGSRPRRVAACRRRGRRGAGRRAPCVRLVGARRPRARSSNRLAQTYDVDFVKPVEKPEEPPPPPPRGEGAAQAARQGAAEGRAAPAAPPAAAEAAKVLMQEPAKDEPVDLTGNTFLNGNAETAVGGVTQIGGKATGPTNNAAAVATGVPGGTGTGPGAAAVEGRPLARGRDHRTRRTSSAARSRPRPMRSRSTRPRSGSK